MKKMALSGIFLLTLMTACSQERSESASVVTPTMKPITTVPFLTQSNDFVYVNKEDLKPVSDQHFTYASLYTPTGYAIVVNANRENAVIDLNGKIVIDYTDQEISLDLVNGLTFYKKDSEYEKKMPFYKWEWNIMGSGVKKEQTYRKIEIGIVESKQVLLKKDIPYLDPGYYLNFMAVDENHVFWNDVLYKIKNSRLEKIESNISELLDNKRYLKGAGTSFALYDLNTSKVLQSSLAGVEDLPIRIGNENVVLKEVNKERFAPAVPKLLKDGKTDAIYLFPQYDKAFPKAIKQATAAQIDFIKKTTLVYSINNSPYFLLGVFNNDDVVWAYEWLYVDGNGNVKNTLDDTYGFKIFDQVGNLVWPDRRMIFPNDLNTEKWKFGKITTYSGMEDVYLIPIENQQEIRTKGLWNSKTKNWDIKPEYHDVTVLDAEKGIYALQRTEKGLFTLYNNKAKQPISSKGYNSINSDGLVSVAQEAGETMHYYIDIYTGKEYKEN